MEAGAKPDLKVAQKALPGALLKAIGHLMQMKLEGCALVGGTALSGFYTGHRRSDDIDLFTRDEFSQKAAVQAVKSLPDIGVSFEKESPSPFYYRAFCSLQDHHFTVDVTQDKNLFAVGGFHRLNGLMIADLKTLLSMKSAALVSRCGEKDLSDLSRLFAVFPDLPLKEFVELGRTMDRGVDEEAMLASVGGTELRPEACDFSLEKSADQVHRELRRLQKSIVQSLQELLAEKKPPVLGELIKYARKTLC